jgi:hypothetical protein
MKTACHGADGAGGTVRAARERCPADEFQLLRATAMTRMILLGVGVCLAGAVCMAQTAPQTAAPQAALDQVRIDVVNEMLPIAEAVKQVERRFGRVVTYEDVPHVAPSDLVDITDRVAKVNPRTTRVYVPRGDSIRLAYMSRYATLDAQAGEALAQLLAVWNGGADHSGRFRVERVVGGDRKCVKLPGLRLSKL